MAVRTPRKVCSRCGVRKAPDAFGANGPGKLRAECRDCRNAAARKKPAAPPPVRAAPASKRAGSSAAPAPTPPPGLAELVAAGRARWHQCDGADAHPSHRAAHRAGFWTEGYRVVAFIEAVCVYPDGPKVGQIVETMIPWQRELTYQLFTLRDDGHRQYRRALVGVAKKNNKTGFASWIALYCAVDTSTTTGQIVCAAASEDQADLVFSYTKSVAEASPILKELTGGDTGSRACLRFEREIQVVGMPMKSLKRLAVGGGNLDGRPIYVAIEDELHEWLTPKSIQTHTVLNRGTILNPDSIVVMITTAGADPESIEATLYEYGKKLESGEIEDETFLFVWYEAPETASGAFVGRGPYERAEGEPIDYRSLEGFLAANPSEGFTVTYARYLEDLKDPTMSEGIARRYHLNQHTTGSEPWLPESRSWDSWAVPELVIRPGTTDRTVRTVASIDASTKWDSTAISWWEIARDDELPDVDEELELDLEEGEQEDQGPRLALPRNVRVRSKSRVWERPRDPMTGQPVATWNVPLEELEHHLYAMHFGTARREAWTLDGACRCCGEVFEPLHLEAIGYDPAFLDLQVNSMWRPAGLPMVEIPQTDQRMVAGFQALITLLAQDRLEHDGNPAVKRHVGNAIARDALRTRGRRLDRPKTSVRRPIDAASTLVMNAYLALQAATAKPGKPKFYAFGGAE
ncbi:Terminase large subunit, Lambdalikevirus-type [uncultured Caudovirales phage]|uniref:Terminase large subunit, Lambdalikevirus-type n=1 Tax=uncultured Caudovirales phage TaxID=2100421 RepID=A0A6J5PVY0_9CAUD|nr:Terminase large subunit, Lambdalikevirus-type [uncultured Caudovirales phage]CAB4173385.1 Terminase large subunit, Lambdalikevirus-type [uncultured Caudovirales phage]CAB4179703.1 Terminase large subunit, Lambdalikevirus-type [uncultured Caudovirales phage]CAB4204004.1 Terminase large subunit, Lambdalikevirus-type [uncultured Caudovirales phage]CAB4215927.1 Terminase large subunit, Lambdalikevirus-type [uncultured Caudovirales phage]